MELAQVDSPEPLDRIGNACPDAAAAWLSLVAIGALLGHESPQMTSRYIDWADDPLREASTRVASRISSAMEATVSITLGFCGG
jgi:hypothetical protein